MCATSATLHGWRSVYTRDLWPALVLARLGGLFPASLAPRPGTGQLRHLPSFATCYAVVTFLFWSAYIVAELFFRMANGQGGTVAFYRGLCYQLFVLAVPFTFWTRVKSVRNYLSRWSEFEISYYQVTGTMLVINQRRASVIAVILSATLSTATTCRYVYVEPSFWIRYAPLIWYVLMLRYLTNSLWILTFRAFTAASHSLSHELRVAASKHRSSDLRVAALGKYRDLWLELSALLRAAGDAVHGAFATSCSLHFVHLTLCAYGFVAQMRHGWTAALEMLLQGATSLVFLLAVVITAQRASDQAGLGVQRELERIVSSGIDLQTKRQVLMFLQAMVANKPLVTLGDFVVVNKRFLTTIWDELNVRRLLLVGISKAGVPIIQNQRNMRLDFSNIKILSTLVSYLVVLLQVQSSFSDDDLKYESQRNASNIGFNSQE